MTDYQRRRYGDFQKAYNALMKYYTFTPADLPGEVWLPIPNYEELYHESNYGRTKSFCHKTPRIMRPSLQYCGYLIVRLSKNGVKRNFYVHALVAALFVPNPLNLPEVDHINGDKLNCTAANLRWVTSSQNKKAAFELGLMKSGEMHHNAKLNAAQVVYVRENPDRLSIYELAEKFSVSEATIRRIRLGNRYKNTGGEIHSPQKFGEYCRIPDEIRYRIKADYQKNVRGHGCIAVAKRFDVAPQTVWKIIHETEDIEFEKAPNKEGVLADE